MFKFWLIIECIIVLCQNSKNPLQFPHCPWDKEAECNKQASGLNPYNAPKSPKRLLKHMVKIEITVAVLTSRTSLILSHVVCGSEYCLALWFNPRLIWHYRGGISFKAVYTTTRLSSWNPEADRLSIMALAQSQVQQKALVLLEKPPIYFFLLLSTEQKQIFYQELNSLILFTLFPVAWMVTD